MNDDTGQREPMIHRARTVAAGFADVGLTHAEELLRRMSPEGREQTRRERKARARRRQRLLVRLVGTAIATLLTGALLAAVAPAGVAISIAFALMLLLTTLVFVRAAPRAPGREALAGTALPGLAEQAVTWLAAQRRGLPLPALDLVATMSTRFDDLTPLLGRLDPRSPAAASLRKLIAVEMPALVDGWRVVPISARRVPHADGRTPDDHLINGLRLIDAELARASDQLGRTTLDDIAVQGRYLELKYSGDSAV
ncbi:hypothetical protein [Sphingomonas sp. OK281]|uniref:hypothetical protein n=1 Tax=Sphingomonas sp. OK281 TaxID=1881067 RepID=UPI0008E8FC32|nr:hypothetical protein [Sphingomonas sp. OK281]SFO39747.1 hypothetical protein SAMN05428984_3903 [Sphingomonas sp. OK281]